MLLMLLVLLLHSSEALTAAAALMLCPTDAAAVDLSVTREHLTGALLAEAADVPESSAFCSQCYKKLTRK